MIADEAHHLGEDLAWGESFAAAFARASRWLLLSGTPFRSDATPIPGVEYDADGLAEPDISYTYADAVRDRVCRPVVFVTYDGTLSWRSGDDVIESSFDTVLSTREASRRYRTAISTDLPDGLPRILGEADARLRALRAEGHRDAGGLVVAADSEHARRIAARLREVSGRLAGRRPAPGRQGGRQARRLHELRRSLDRRRQHGLRGRRHSAAAGRCLRDRGQDAADLPPDRRALRAHDRRAQRPSRAGSTSRPTRSCAITPRPSSRSCATWSGGPARTRGWASSMSSSGARPSGARCSTSSR